MNDLYDRAFGDGVLRLTAQLISQMLPSNADIYRLDGDEFGIIILNGKEGEALKVFDNIRNKFCRQQEFNGKKYYCTISAGCAVYPSDADNYLDLLKFATYSLEHSKQKGKNRITMFSGELIQEKERTLELAELLRESIEHGFAGFPSIISLRSMRIPEKSAVRRRWPDGTVPNMEMSHLQSSFLFWSRTV